MHDELYSAFISKLQQLYGDMDRETKRFPSSSNSHIARELGYSDAQFSRLINAHATDGEYNRANQNADRILQLIAFREKFEKINIDPTKALASPRKRVLFFVAGLVLGGFFFFLVFRTFLKVESSSTTKFDMLTWTFDSNVINPYVGLRELPGNCDFECYKYQGRWELKEPYKLPFLRERSGFHYLAKSVVAYVRCLPEDNPDGKQLEGYEYQEHQIWYDILERPIGEFVRQDGEVKETYQQLQFEQQEEFILIGTIHSFYTNDFVLDSAGIHRHGQDIGRDLELISEAELAKQVKNQSLLEKIRREINAITQDPIRDFSKPSNCRIAKKPKDDFHKIANGDIVRFDCEMTTAGRFTIDYSKSYVLTDQYIRDQCVSQ